MFDKFAVNQRVRELMAALGYANNVEGFYKRYIGEGRSERLRAVVKDINPIKTDFLVEIAESVAQIEGRKPNTHWILMGEGEMFFEKNSDTTQLLIQTQRELLSEYRDKIDQLNKLIEDLRHTTPTDHDH